MTRMETSRSQDPGTLLTRFRLGNTWSYSHVEDQQEQTQDGKILKKKSPSQFLPPSTSFVYFLLSQASSQGSFPTETQRAAPIPWRCLLPYHLNEQGTTGTGSLICCLCRMTPAKPATLKHQELLSSQHMAAAGILPWPWRPRWAT